MGLSSCCTNGKGGSEGVQVVVTSVDLLVAELLLVVICNFASSPDLS